MLDMDAEAVTLTGSQHPGFGFLETVISLSGAQICTTTPVPNPCEKVPGSNQDNRWAPRLVAQEFADVTPSTTSLTVDTSALTGVDLGALQASIPASWLDATLSFPAPEPENPSFPTCMAPGAGGFKGCSPDPLRFQVPDVLEQSPPGPTYVAVRYTIYPLVNPNRTYYEPYPVMLSDYASFPSWVSSPANDPIAYPVGVWPMTSSEYDETCTTRPALCYSPDATCPSDLQSCYGDPLGAIAYVSSGTVVWEDDTGGIRLETETDMVNCGGLYCTPTNPALGFAPNGIPDCLGAKAGTTTQCYDGMGMGWGDDAVASYQGSIQVTMDGNPSITGCDNTGGSGSASGTRTAAWAVSATTAGNPISANGPGGDDWGAAKGSNSLSTSCLDGSIEALPIGRWDANLSLAGHYPATRDALFSGVVAHTFRAQPFDTTWAWTLNCTSGSDIDFTPRQCLAPSGSAVLTGRWVPGVVPSYGWQFATGVAVYQW
jgi:hypothetical protein